MGKNLNITVLPKNSEISVMSIEGNIDINSSPELREYILVLIKKKVPVIMINLSEVRYMDSSGLATFLESLKNVRKYQGKFILFNLQSLVKSVFEMTKLDKIFEIYENEKIAFENV